MDVSSRNQASGGSLGAETSIDKVLVASFGEFGRSPRIGGPRAEGPLPTLPQGFNAVTDFIPVARIADMLLRGYLD